MYNGPKEEIKKEILLLNDHVVAIECGSTITCILLGKKSKQQKQHIPWLDTTYHIKCMKTE